MSAAPKATEAPGANGQSVSLAGLDSKESVEASLEDFIRQAALAFREPSHARTVVTALPVFEEWEPADPVADAAPNTEVTARTDIAAITRPGPGAGAAVAAGAAVVAPASRGPSPGLVAGAFLGGAVVVLGMLKLTGASTAPTAGLPEVEPTASPTPATTPTVIPIVAPGAAQPALATVEAPAPVVTPLPSPAVAPAPLPVVVVTPITPITPIGPAPRAAVVSAVATRVPAPLRSRHRASARLAAHQAVAATRVAKAAHHRLAPRPAARPSTPSPAAAPTKQDRKSKGGADPFAG